MDLREYEPGDDLRHIDWNVTARMDTPYVREYVEDREVTAWLLLDRSASMGFGPVDRQKHLVVTEVAATIAQLLARGGNRVGAILFDNAVERTIPPGHGRQPGAADHVPPDGPAPPRQRSDRPCRPAAGRPGGGPAPVRRGHRVGLHQRARLGGAAHLVDPAARRRRSAGRRPARVRPARRRDDLRRGRRDRGAESSSTPTTRRSGSGCGKPRSSARAPCMEATRSAGTDLFTIGTDEDLVRALVRVAELRKRRRR